MAWPPTADVLSAALRALFSGLPGLRDAASGRTGQPWVVTIILMEKQIHRKELMVFLKGETGGEQVLRCGWYFSLTKI
jgi:hypothetical protein